MPIPTQIEMQQTFDQLDNTHTELIELGNALDSKKTTYESKRKQLQEIMKLLRENKEDEAMELFAPAEKQSLQDAGDAFSRKQNQFNKLVMLSQHQKNMIDAARVLVDASGLGLKV